jgi:hypothetical protein
MMLEEEGGPGCAPPQASSRAPPLALSEALSQAPPEAEPALKEVGASQIVSPESQPQSTEQHSLASAGGAARSVLRSALLTVTRTAPIGQLPIRHVAKGIGAADRVAELWESARGSLLSPSEGGTGSWRATLVPRAGLFGYGLAKNAFMGSLLFEAQGQLSSQLHLSTARAPAHYWLLANPFWQPAVAGLAAGALHGLCEHGFDKAEACARFGVRAWLRELAAAPRTWLRLGLREAAATMGRHAASHATLFGIYFNSMALLGPHASELRDEARLRQEYGHLLLATALAGGLAGVAQELVSARASGLRVAGADLRKSGLASIVGFLAFEFSRFEDDA